MKRRKRQILLFILLLALISSLCDADCKINTTVRDIAFHTIAHKHTGVIYNVSDTDAFAIKLRRNSLWRNGVNIKSFKIPPKTLPVPYARRFFLVYERISNLSSCSIPDYTAATPVVAISAYNESLMPLELVTVDDPILIAFPYVDFPRGVNSSLVKCARFGLGSVELTDAEGWHGCSANSSGYFAMVFPSGKVVSPPYPVPGPTGGRTWVVWAVVCGGGVVGGAVLALIGVGISRLVKRRRVRRMERKAEEGVGLDEMWIGGSKMPSASMARTHPVLQDTSLP